MENSGKLCPGVCFSKMLLYSYSIQKGLDYYFNVEHSLSVCCIISLSRLGYWLNKRKKQEAQGKIGAWFISHILCPHRPSSSSHHHKPIAGPKQSHFQKQLKVGGKKMDTHNSRQFKKDLLKFEMCSYLFIDYFQHTGVELILESSRNEKRSTSCFIPPLNQNYYNCFLCWYFICGVKCL